MVQGSASDTEHKILAILKVLNESSEPLGSITIARELERHGIFLSERAVRYHLRITDERGHTQPFGRDGRMLTAMGLEELKVALAPEHVGFVLEKLETLAFQTTFNPKKQTGLVPINTSLINKNKFKEVLAIMGEAFTAGFGVSEFIAVAHQGEKLSSVIIPEGKIGIGTICSVVVNGVLSKSGVPIESRFGGVLELRNPKPERFVAIIYYNGTSLDPSEQYIRARMTSVREAAKTSKGRILANFREIPAPSRALVSEKLTEMKEAGIGGVYRLGNTSESICQIPVGLNRVGMVFLGGLNSMAAVSEAGIEVENNSESGVIEFQQLVNFRKYL
jgi:HTH-type transcriptional regulator, global nitrogen regulator NrpRI